MESTILSVLRAIRQHQPVTRRVLSERTGLGMSRVSALVSRMVSCHLVQEQILPEGAPGRPVSVLAVNPDAGCVVGLDIGGRTSRAVLCDFGGQVLASEVRPTDAVPDRALILQHITRLIQEVCAQGGIAPEKLAALGVGLQGIVDTRTGMAIDWPNTPSWAASWAGLDVAGELKSGLGLELVVVDDSVRAMSLTAHRFGLARGSNNFLYVFLGNGIGFGMFVDGSLYRGSGGVAGELGHVTVREDGPWCHCGNRGCLEVLASTSAILERVRERLKDSCQASVLRTAYEQGELSLEKVILAAHAGDKLAFQVLDEAGTYVGMVLAMALNLLGLDLVVLGGPIAQGEGIVLEAVRRQVKLRALQYISARTRIICDDQGELAGARGAGILALDALFGSDEHLIKLIRS